MTHHKLAHDKLAHGAWVFVGDGRKALFPINKRDETFPNPHPDAEDA